MKREIYLHTVFYISFFVFITIFQKYFDVSYWVFWIGGLFGTILPDIDHLLYLYLKPQELTTQRAQFYWDRNEIKRIFTLLYETRGERRGLIFHSVLFQLIFLVLTFWIVTSSGSLFGKGMVLAFSLHLLIDQIADIVELRSFDNWTKGINYQFDLQKAKLYWLGVLILVLILGLFF